MSKPATSNTVRLAILIVGFAVMTVGTAAADPPVATPAAPPHPVTASFLADVIEIAPDMRFRIGLRLRLEPGWHVYWKNPGDAGLSTAVEFRVPEGFQCRELQWPIPERFGQPGDIEGFGYADSVLFVADVTAPPDLLAGAAITFGVAADWLVCRTVCIQGKAELSLELPVVAQVPDAVRPGRGEADRDRTAFEYWRDRLPRPDAGPDRPFARTTSGELGADRSGRFEIALAWKERPAAVEWFPAPGEDYLVDDVSTTHEGRHTLIGFRVRALTGAEDREAPSQMESLVVYTDTGGHRHGVTAMVPIPPAHETKERSIVDG